MKIDCTHCNIQFFRELRVILMTACDLSDLPCMNVRRSIQFLFLTAAHLCDLRLWFLLPHYSLLSLVCLNEQS